MSLDLEFFHRSLRDPILNEKSIIAARKFVVAWEHWFDKNRANCSDIESDFHDMTIRYLKGMIKLWRIWLSRQPRNLDNSSHGALGQE